MNAAGPAGLSLKEAFPLHYLAKIGDAAELERYLSAHSSAAIKQVTRLDFSGRSIIHYTAVGVNAEGCKKCLDIILTFLNDLEGEKRENFATIAVRRQTTRIRRQQWKGDDSQETINFINLKDTGGETALHLAAKNENTNIVITLLLHSADVMAVSKSGVEALKLIYAKTPAAITELLNRSVSFDYGIDTDAFVKTERSYCLDFTAIIGNMGGEEEDGARHKKKKRNAAFQETACLNSVNENETRVRKELLTHPLVRFFVEKKFQKLLWTMWASIALKLVWISLYIWHAVDIYYDCCESPLDDIRPLLPDQERVYCSKYPFSPDVMNWTQTETDLVKGAVVECTKQSNSVIRQIVILLMTVYVIFTVAFKAFVLMRAYLKIQNCFMWIYIVLVLLTLFPSESWYKAQFQITAFSVIMGALVILEIVNKHIYWAIYIRVLIKVTKRFLAIFPLFLFLMLAFSVSLRMLFPTVNPAVHDFRDTLMEVFSVIANGKVEWTEGNNYRDEVDKQFSGSGFIMFIVFYVILILLLFRILIGFVVADTKKIQEEEELNEISQDLKAVYLFESISVSRIYQRLSSFGCLSFLNKFRERFMICPQASMQLWIVESDIPAPLRKPMQSLASKNPVKSKKHEQWQRSTENNNSEKVTNNVRFNNTLNTIDDTSQAVPDDDAAYSIPDVLDAEDEDAEC